MNIQTTLKSFFIATVINLNIVAHVNAQEWTLTPQTYCGIQCEVDGFFYRKRQV